MRNILGTAALGALALVPGWAQSEDQPVLEGQLSNAEIAKELANPNTTLGSLNFPIDYVSYKGDAPGASSQESWRVGFQPILPYPLNETTNLYVRPNFPVLIDQPVPKVNGVDVSSSAGGQFTTQGSSFDNSDMELGDISFDIAIGKSFPSATVLAAGVVGTLDTATDDAVGLGQTESPRDFRRLFCVSHAASDDSSSC